MVEEVGRDWSTRFRWRGLRSRSSRRGGLLLRGDETSQVGEIDDLYVVWDRCSFEDPRRRRSIHSDGGEEVSVEFPFLDWGWSSSWCSQSRRGVEGGLSWCWSRDRRRRSRNWCRRSSDGSRNRSRRRRDWNNLLLLLLLLLFHHHLVLRRKPFLQSLRLRLSPLNSSLSLLLLLLPSQLRSIRRRMHLVFLHRRKVLHHLRRRWSSSMFRRGSSKSEGGVREVM